MNGQPDNLTSQLGHRTVAETTAAYAAEPARPQPAERIRALALLEAADFLRDAHYRDGLSVQEIGTALRYTLDEADPMVGSLARDGLGHDEIATMLSAATEAQQAAADRCTCRAAAHAQHHNTPVPGCPWCAATEEAQS